MANKPLAVMWAWPPQLSLAKVAATPKSVVSLMSLVEPPIFSPVATPTTTSDPIPVQNSAIITQERATRIIMRSSNNNSNRRDYTAVKTVMLIQIM